ncbi:hypothetical protein ACJJTC_018409, partial [Scirpophaga incertulas]
TAEDVEDACKHITNSIQVAAWLNTPLLNSTTDHNKTYPMEIRDKIAEKRRLRRIWQQSRRSSDKTMLNKAIKDLRAALESHKNVNLKQLLEQASSSGQIERFKKAHVERLTNHPNPLASNLLTNANVVHRLRRNHVL